MSKYDSRVIEILDEYSIIINYGRNDGASEDDEVRVIAIGPEIMDPDTGDNLGTLDSIKATLSLVTVYDNFSICKKIELKTNNVLMSPLSQFQTITKTIKPLNINKDQISNKKAPEDKIIKIGDIVEIL